MSILLSTMTRLRLPWSCQHLCPPQVFEETMQPYADCHVEFWDTLRCGKRPGRRSPAVAHRHGELRMVAACPGWVTRGVLRRRCECHSSRVTNVLEGYDYVGQHEYRVIIFFPQLAFSVAEAISPKSRLDYRPRTKAVEVKLSSSFHRLGMPAIR